MASNRNWGLILLTFIVFTGFLVNYLDRVPKRHYCDYRVYYKAGKDLVHGKNIYIRESEDVTPYKYSPFFAFAFAPLSLLPIKASAAVFFTINFFLTILFFKLSYELAENSGLFKPFSSRDRFLVYFLTFIYSIRYICLVWDSGQVSILMCVLVLLALGFMFKDKAPLSGAFFAASALIKYTPVIFLPYLFFKRKTKVVYWAVFFAGIFLALPVLIVGIAKNNVYLTSWIPTIITTSLDHFSLTDPKNQSIFSMFLRFFSATTYGVQIVSLSFDQALWGGRIFALAMLLLVFIPGRSKQGELAISTALLMNCMSLFNPNAWMLNFVSLIPSYMLLFQHTIANKAKDRFVLLLLIAAFVLSNFMSRDALGKSSELFACAYSFTTLGALIIYAAVLKLKFFPFVPGPQPAQVS